MSSVSRVFEDVTLLLPVSVEGSFVNPENEDNIDGDAGGTFYKSMWVAIEQTKLATGIDDIETAIVTSAARFVDTTLNSLLCGTEKMEITAGWGTVNLVVVRGAKGTTPAAHLADAPIYLCYTLKTATIVAHDSSSPSRAAWKTYCLYSGENPDGNYNTHPAALALGDIDPGDSVRVYRKLIVPAATPAVSEQDIMDLVSATLEEYVP